jgi:uncharacterized membrane protein
MAIEEVTNVSTTALANLIKEIGQIGLWIQALGLVIVLWLIFQIIAVINNRIKRKKLYTIEQRLENIEKKINKILKIIGR